MADPFSKYGIDHLSVSSLNLYAAEPARWVAKYLYKIDDAGGPRMWRGNAVEAGLNQALAGESDEVAAKVAMSNFYMNFPGFDEFSPKSEDLADEMGAEAENIHAMLKLVADNLRPLGRPLMTQRRVERRIPGIEVPIIGYVDLEYEDFLLELKTTLRMPSAPRADHAVQVVSYGDSLGKRPGLIYVTPKKLTRFAEEHIDLGAARWTLRRSALALRIMLEVAADREEAAMLQVPRFDDFRWSEDTIKAAKEIWK